MGCVETGAPRCSRGCWHGRGLGGPRQRSPECGICWNACPFSTGVFKALYYPLTSVLKPSLSCPYVFFVFLFRITIKIFSPWTCVLCVLGLGSSASRSLYATIFTSCRSWPGVPPQLEDPSLTPADLEQPFISTPSPRAPCLELFFMHLPQTTSQTFYLRIYVSVCSLFSLDTCLSQPLL